MRDPYEVLGVPRTATADTIKQAYRKLAKQLHPDLHPNDKAIETKFKEVSAAHDLLSDTVKRGRFDRGEIDASGAERPNSRYYKAYAGRGEGGRSSPFDADDIFEMFNEDIRRRNSEREAPRRRGADVNYSLSVDFIAASAGTKRRLTLPDGRTLDVTIPPGTLEGTVLRLRGQGQPGAAGAGDALIEIQVEPHPFFERRDNDIHVEVPVTLQEAVLGATITVPTIDGNVAVKVPKASNSGTTLRLRGRGIAAQKGGARGDQYVRLMISLPARIDDELKDFMERWSPSHSYRVRSKLGIDD
jgi:DnaJ-class molecular chaperone